MIPTKIIWHHSADPSRSRQREKIDAFHKKRDFPISSLGFYGGYHFLIEHDGFVHRYRVPSEQGYHDAGENEDSIGICLAGNFNTQLPTKDQASSMADLLRMLTWNYQIPLSRIFPHRGGDHTDCPGTKLSDKWPEEQLLKYWPQQKESEYIPQPNP